MIALQQLTAAVVLYSIEQGKTSWPYSRYIFYYIYIYIYIFKICILYLKIAAATTCKLY